MKTVKSHFRAFFSVLFITIFICQSVFAATKAEIDTLAAHFPESWPEAPEITSESAILVEINSGAIVYAKNPTRSMYPASTTKLMTAYLTLTNCDLDEIITYSSKAVLSLEPGSSHIGLKVGESLNVEDSLYGLLLPSANEVANGLAEHISGSISSFADLMNETAASLGCVNTNFCNANGLHDPNHMTCAYDLYLIMLACIQQSDYVRISSSKTYVRPSDELLAKEIPMATTNQFLKKDSELYEPSVVCGKTGWTQEAGRCLVTYASQGDMDLICVVMNSENPNQYKDTQILLNYAYRNFRCVRPYDLDSQLSPGMLETTSPLGLAEDPVSILELDSSSRILLPSSCDFSSLTRKVTSSEAGSRRITYRLNGYPLGTASIVAAASDTTNGLWNSSDAADTIMDNLTISRLHTVNLWLLASAVSAAILLTALIILAVKIRNAPKETPSRDEEHYYHLQ